MNGVLKFAIPDLSKYPRQTGIGRVLYSLLDELGNRVEVSEARYVRSRLPVLRNFAIGVRNVPLDADLVLFPQLTGVGALSSKSRRNSAVIVHDLGVYDSLEDSKSTNFLTRTVIRRDVRHLDYANHIISVSHFTKNRLISMMPQLEPKVTVIHSGVSPIFCQHQKSKESCRRSLERLVGCPFGYPLLLYVGTERRRKNVVFLMDVVKRLKSIYPDLVLLKVGSPGSEQERQRVLEHMGALGLRVGQDVHFVNYMEDKVLADAYRAADAYVSASLYEGFGLPYVESLAVGTPVVALETGVLTSQMPGVYFGRPSVEDFTEAVVRSLSNKLSPEQEEKLRRFIRREFSWNRFASKVLDTVTSSFDSTEKVRRSKGAW